MNITIYGTHTCPYCINVKTFLEGRDTSYDYKIVGDDISMTQLEEIVGRSIKTVPVIVVDGDELSFDSLRTKINTLGLSL